MKTIYLGADHGGFELKEKIKGWLKRKKIPFEDMGNVVHDVNDDYPDFAVNVARKVAATKSKGILLCGSAEGMCIAANKIKGVRAVNPASVIQTRFAREHEDTNVVCLAGGGSRKKQPSLSTKEAIAMISVFLSTPFSGDVRHKRRLAKIKSLER